MTITLQDRMRGAIWGQLVGDAAALGAHWIYDIEELQARYPEIRGFEMPHEDHYHAGKQPGNFTHYGDAALEMLRSVADRQGFSAIDFGTRFIEKFSSPNYRGYLDKATRGTIENYRFFQDGHPDEQFDYQEGADDDQPGTATRLAPVLVAHWNDPKLLEIVESATRVTQNNGQAIVYMHSHAKIVHSLFLGKDLKLSFEEAASYGPHDTPIDSHVKRKIGEALKLIHLPVGDATLKLGQSCSLEKSFPSAVHAALKHKDSFVKAILETIKAGGDSAGRAGLVGTWLGAFLGHEGIPQEWKRQVKHYDEIESAIEMILSNLKAAKT